MHKVYKRSKVIQCDVFSCVQRLYMSEHVSPIKFFILFFNVLDINFRKFLFRWIVGWKRRKEGVTGINKGIIK